MNSIEYGLLLKSHSPARAKELLSQRYSILGSQKPILVLHETLRAAPPGRSARARKSATTKALAAFMATGDRTYDRYLPLHDLWQQYMAELLGPKCDTTTAAHKLLSADWSGAYLRVCAATSPSLVGKEGILLWESRQMLLIVTKANRFVQITKKGTVFTLDTQPALQFIGSRLGVRSVERTTRKFKPHDVSDIATLLEL